MIFNNKLSKVLTPLAGLLLVGCTTMQRMALNAAPTLACYRPEQTLEPPSIAPKDTAYTPGKLTTARTYLCRAGR